MKNSFKQIIAVLATTAAMVSCSNDDNNSAIVGNGDLNLEFDNAFGDNDLILNNQPNTTSNGEVLKISTVKYIVSNIKLTNEDGSTFVYPKSESYFIVDETDLTSQIIALKDIPAGNYTKVTFGIGVDKAQFDLGAVGQGDFLAHAQSEDMLWSWSAGYKFVAFEGIFTSSTTTAETPFMVHTGQTGTDYNYTEITLPLPIKAIVRENVKPQIHVITDVSKVIDGENKIKLSDNNMGGMGAMIMGGALLPKITQNLSGMFSVDHVHND